MNISETADLIYRSQRTERGQNYERYMRALRGLRSSSRSEDRERCKRLDESVLRIRGVSPGQVHANQIMSTISVQYANDEFIGERLMPMVPVAKRSDSYAIFPKRERLAYPDDSLGERGRATELSESRQLANYSVRDYGFQNYIDSETLDNQDGAFDEMADLTDSINEGIAFRREKRLAAILTAAASYSGNTTALSGTSQWDSAGGGDPIKNLLDWRAALWQGRGASDIVAFSSLEVYNILARHPAIRDLFKYTADGLASRAQLAGYFGFSDYLVGMAREDTANLGQTAAYGRIWGKAFGIVRVARRPSRRNASFGVTFRLTGDPKALNWFDPAVGKGGGYYAKVAVSEDHRVIAGDTGYLGTTVIA